ncbi:hypothetical protein M3Y99_01383900 [Aphelenchoides fujianensis]|nr:hypothetical protein M3Y99_01383900 [Aphelenchoides fujianensis]
MDSWDDDDYDPTAHVSARVADAVATLGLDDKLKAEKAEAEKQAAAQKAAAAQSKGAKSTKTSGAAGKNREMSAAEILELQKRGDLEIKACSKRVSSH